MSIEISSFLSWINVSISRIDFYQVKYKLSGDILKISAFFPKLKHFNIFNGKKCSKLTAFKWHAVTIVCDPIWFTVLEPYSTEVFLCVVNLCICKGTKNCAFLKKRYDSDKNIHPAL